MFYRTLRLPLLGPQLRVHSLSGAAQGPLLRLGYSPHRAIRRGAQVVAYARGVSTARYRRVYMSESSDTERAYQLLPTYLENPGLALSIREFIIGEPWYGISETCPLHNDAEHAAVERRVRELGLGSETTRVMLDSLDCRRQGLQGESGGPHGNVFAATITAVLLSLCGNINTLYFDWELHPGPLRDYLLASNYGLTSRPALQQLQHVAFRTPKIPSEDRWFDNVDVLDILRCVHRLPRVTSLSMEGVADGLETVIDEPFPPKTSQSLRRVHMGHTGLQSHLLATLLRIPAGLEEISLSFGGLWKDDDPCAYIAPALLEKALRQHKPTLRMLDLDMGSAAISDCDGRPVFDPEDPDFTANRYYQIDLAASEGPVYAHELEDNHETLALGSLRDYKALTHLSVSIDLLTTALLPGNSIGLDETEFRLVDALPANLEYLCLYAYEKGKDKENDSHVEELMRRKSERLPRLREVVGVDHLVPGVFTKPEGWTSFRSHPEDALWDRPDDGLDGVWVEE